MRQDDPVYQEAFEKLLDSWMCFVLEASELPDGCLTHPSTEIINTYLQCHLAPPDGTRHQVRSDAMEDCLFILWYILGSPSNVS